MSIDVSLDKAAQSRFGTHKASWQEADSWLGPLMEYARISSGRHDKAHDLKNSLDNGTFRRFSFFKWEVESLLGALPNFSLAQNEPQGLEALNKVFFVDLGFRTATGSAQSFENILAQRTGPPALIAMIYSWISERLLKLVDKNELGFSRIELVHGTPHGIVRAVPTKHVGQVTLLDLSKQGARVDEQDWTSWCTVSRAKGFERMTWSQGLTRALTELFAALDPGSTQNLELLEAQLYVLDQIMALQPSETRRWADRAILNTRRGDAATALKDLKRFFAFHEKETAPPSIVRLYEDLL